MSTARIVTLMGSGETSPTMVRVHRHILERLGPPPVRTLLLDTPFGFQENAGELSARVAAYFKESLNTTIEVAGSASSSGREGSAEFADEQLTLRLQAARYVFSGPGSPTYALRKWAGSVVPGLLGEKLGYGGAVTFASAAALTLGVVTVPVYEIYKVGEDPHWLEGLDLLALAGLKVAAIPHYNNAEGGTHDTRYCYLGERRLRVLEDQLPEGAFVLGVDEHTACVIDIDGGTASVEGLGFLTVRSRGRSETVPSGETVAIAELVSTAERLAAGGGPLSAAGPVGQAAQSVEAAGSPVLVEESVLGTAAPPLVGLVREVEERFRAAISDRDVGGAVAAILDLESRINEWSSDIPGSDELSRARASLRSMVVELGSVAEVGAKDPAEVLGPFVESLLAVREDARREHRYAESDAVRDRLAALGVAVRDTAGGTEWALSSPAP